MKYIALTGEEGDLLLDDGREITPGPGDYLREDGVLFYDPGTRGYLRERGIVDPDTLDEFDFFGAGFDARLEWDGRGHRLVVTSP